MSSNNWWVAALVGGVVTVALSATVKAEEQNVNELDQRLKVLERKLEIADETAATRAKESPTVSASAKDGFSIQSADKAFQLRLRGLVQADGRFFLEDDAEAASDTFVLRRVRAILEGQLYKDIDFRVMPDFGGGSTSIQDAYAGIKFDDSLRLRVGKFRPPVGLERLQSAADTRLVERGHPTSLLPNRDVGAQLFGTLLDGTVEYAAGVFNGVTDGSSGDSDSDDGKDFAGRLFLTPFRNQVGNPFEGLGVGVAATVGDAEGTTSSPGLSSYRSIGQTRVFQFKTSTNAADAVVADGERARLTPQAYYYVGPFGLLSEYATSSQDVKKGDKTANIENEAWQLQLSYVLTGEANTYRGIVPAANFDPAAGTWGAFELVARLSELDIDDAAFPTFADPAKSVSGIETWGIGLNWYLNRNVKAAIDYEQSSFDGGAKSGDLADEKVLFTRVQLAF